ncbi:MAG: N-acetylmuramoyl-L-alanine amidase, partial [Planctomycetes bacterium]|nr:N-acetylmuramoyl-L-alanine amidase [Planctomycetota bacterium]
SGPSTATSSQLLPQRRQRSYRYVVQKGDTLSALSRRSGLSINVIISHNRLRSHAIYPGNTLYFPGVSSLGKDPLKNKTDSKKYVSEPNGSYRIVKRRSWTKQGVRKNHRVMTTVNRITIHHTGEHGDIVKLPDLEVVKRIENYHRNERKWAAIGYHYLVGRDGTVYEGRPSRYQGAHTRSNNRNNLGISVIGDFNKRHPNSKQLATLHALLDDMRREYNVSARSVFGHRDLSPSVCPGKHLYTWVQQYKNS